jgi:hypothetical protein
MKAVNNPKKDAVEVIYEKVDETWEETDEGFVITIKVSMKRNEPLEDDNEPNRP